MSEKIITHKAKDREAVIVNPDAIYTVVKSGEKMIKYYARNVIITIVQKKIGETYIDDAIYVDYFY